jgi:PAS domain S-box-containing protein
MRPIAAESAETVLVRREGDDIVFLSPLRHNSAPPVTFRRPANVMGFAALAAVEGHEGFGAFVDYRGEPVFAATIRLDRAPWGIVVKVDQQEALAGYRQEIRRTGTTVIAVILGFWAVAFMLVLGWRRRAEAALREGEERYRATLYSIGDAVIATDQGSRVKQMNPVAEKLTGWTESQASGRPLDEVFRIVNEETHAVVESPVARVLREGHVVGLANHSLLIGKDGKESPIADSGAPIRNEKGGTTGVVLVFRDQTKERAAQKALKESEAFNRTIVESIPQQLFLKDRNGVYLAVNQPYAASLGCRPDQLVGKDDFASYPTELAEKYRADDRAVMESGRVKDLEEKYLAQGKEYWVHTIKAPVSDDGGQVTAVLGLFEDITARKRVEQSLKDARDRLEEAQRAAHLGNWEWDARNDQITGSEEFYRLFDVAPEGLSRFSQFVERLHPDDRERVQRDVADALKQDRPYDTDYRIRLSDGGRRDIIARGRVFVDEGGKPLRMVGTCLDITERKRMEERIGHLNLVLKAIRNVNQLIVREKDPETLIRRSCEVLTETRGYFSAWIALYDESGKQMIAASAGLGDAFESLKDRFRSGQLAACDKAVHERGVHVVRNPAAECPNCSAATLYRGQSAIAVRLEHEGHVHGLLVMSMDPGLVDLVDEQNLIEEVADDIAYALHGLDVEKQRGAAEEDLRKHRDQLEQRVRDRTAQLEESNKELEAFSYSVSHDLRAPLRAIDGFTRLLADDYAPHLDTEGKRLCSIIHENTAKMGRLIDDLLAFSRLGRAEMSLSRIDMETMANSVFHELTTPESRARIDFQVGVLPPVVADTTLMRQVWMNLLSNAIKFSSKRERAVIQVSAQQNQGENVYVVQDNGAGFDMQYVGKLFGVFQRLHSSREFEGTGVGLALVQRVIRRHGGRVWAESEIDKGATFYFALQQRGA